MKRFLWFFVGCVLVALPLFAFAAPTTDTHVDASSSPRVGVVYAWHASSFNKFGSDALSVCKSLVTNNCASPASCRLQANGSNWSCYNNSSYVDNIMANTAAVCISTDPGAAVTCTGSVYSCPVGQNWTLTGSSCDRAACGSPQVRDAGTGLCVAPPNPCVSGASGNASRWVGTFATGVAQMSSGTATPLPSSLCDGQCSGSVASVTSCTASSLAAGTPIQCNYTITKDGSQCSGGNGEAPVYDPCFGQGKVSGTINGQPVCGGSAPTSTSETKVTTTPTSTTTTTTTTTCSGDGSCSSSTTSNTTSGGSGPNGTGTGSSTTPAAKDGEGTNESESSFCAENPSDAACQLKAADAIDVPLGAQPTLYTAKYPNGLKGVWNEQSAAIQATPLFGLTAVFTPSVAAGTCPSWSFDANLGTGMNFGVVPFAPPCWLWPMLKAVLIISALLLSRRLIFGG